MIWVTDMYGSRPSAAILRTGSREPRQENGASTVDSLVVRWPGGDEQALTGLPMRDELTNPIGRDELDAGRVAGLPPAEPVLAMPRPSDLV
jgi:hypothetical protein